MKKTIFILAITAFIAGTIFTGCQSSAKKVANAQDDVIKANEELNKANQEYLEDIKSYRKITAENIIANENNIAEFKARIEKDKKAAKSDYKKKIALLEQKNSDMKKKMDEYTDQGKENWEIFKAEFNNEMDAMAKALKDLQL
jgi:lipopolysaccharide export LptBFGC system permease protein LptF